MTALFNRLMSDESGQDLIEYGLLIGIITAVSVATISSIGGKVKGYFDALDSGLT